MTAYSLEQFVGQFQALLDQSPEWPQLLAQGREMLSQLVSDPHWFRATLSGLALDKAFLKAQWHSIDPNDIQLYVSPDKAFSVRAFIWEPDVNYPIHDHGAWGIVGAHINQLRERKFARVDDGSDEYHIELEQIADATLSRGQTTFVLPLNEGIHQMQAVGDQVAVSIHVYGAPLRKGYINLFDPISHTVRRAYTPTIHKKILALKTLGSIPEDWAKEVLSAARCQPGPDYVQRECQSGRDKLRS